MRLQQCVHFLRCEYKCGVKVLKWQDDGGQDRVGEDGGGGSVCVCVCVSVWGGGSVAACLHSGPQIPADKFTVTFSPTANRREVRDTHIQNMRRLLVYHPVVYHLSNGK